MTTRRPRPLRIAYGRLMQETNALSPVATTRVDFERTHLVDGDALHRRVTGRFASEVPGFATNAELSGFHQALGALAPRGAVTTVPLYSAWAVSGGPLAPDTMDGFVDELRARLADALAAGPIDALYLALHGAMGAVGEPDPEARLLAAARRVIGDVPIAVSLDMHGLLTRDKLANVDMLAAYHTNPHRDHAGTGYRVGRMVLDRLRRGRTPTVAWRSLPVVIGGGPGVDFLAPMRPVFQRLRRLVRDPRVADASLFLSHPWNAHPELGWNVWIGTHDDLALAERLADELAEAAWTTRHEAPPAFVGPAEAIAEIRAATVRRKFGTACICDASDVVGAGGTGESTHLLVALLEGAPDLRSLVPLRDPAAIEALWPRARGERVELTVGGRLGPVAGPAIDVRGIVRAKERLPAFGRVVVLDLGHVQLVVTEAPPLVMKPAFYRALGLDPFRADITVVKSFFPFRLFFLAENRLTRYVKTAGITDFDALRALRFAGPVHPIDRVSDWRAEDRRRRGLAPT